MLCERHDIHQLLNAANRSRKNVENEGECGGGGVCDAEEDSEENDKEDTEIVPLRPLTLG